MRCMCSGRSKSYIVTTVKTPVSSAPTKVSVQKVVSVQNGLASSSTGDPKGHVTAAAPTTPLTNGVDTSQTTTTHVQIHNNHNDDVTRYHDTAQTVAKEFTHKSPPKNSTPDGTLTRKKIAPQPVKSKSQETSEIQVTTKHSILKHEVPEQKTSESETTSSKPFEVQVTHENTSESQVTSNKSPKNQVTNEKPLTGEVMPEKILKSQITSHKSSENEHHKISEIERSSSQSDSLIESSHTSIEVRSHKDISTGVSSKSDTSLSTILPVTQETTTFILSTVDDSKSEAPMSTIPATPEITMHTSLTTNGSESETSLSTMPVGREITTFISSTVAESKSETSMSAMPATQENTTHTSSTINRSKSDTSLSIMPVTQETITLDSSTVAASKSETSLSTMPVTQETTLHTSSTVNQSISETTISTIPVTHETTHISSTVTDSKSEISSSTLETAIYTSSKMTSSKSETSLLTIPSPTNTLSKSSSISSMQDLTSTVSHLSLESTENLENLKDARKASVGELIAGSNRSSTSLEENDAKRRSGVQVSVPIGPEVTSEEKLPVFKKTPDDEEKIRKAIEKNEFLSRILSKKRLQDIINAMQPRNVIAKQKLIKQGESGSEMFVSKEGTYKILIKGKVVGEFKDNRVFGELAILYNAKRLASIQAGTTGKVWVLDRDTYRKVVISSNLKEQDENLKFLQNVESLNIVDVEVLRQVSNLLKQEFFIAGTVIIKQGDKGDKFYIIRAGTVKISKTGEGVLGTLVKGKCFGEMALQKEDTRQATVTAEAPGVECLTLSRADFINHFGDVEIPKIEVKKISFKNDAPSEYQEIKLEDLKIVKTLGVGGFGRVELVQHKKKKDMIFALKYLKKIDIVYQNQQEHVYNEKLIQLNSRSPFIVRLYRTYKDNKYVYFLMESCLGGDLFSLLHKQKGKRFDEKDAKFLSACVLEALEHLHSKGVVYRDLKPENLLIDKNGYIKLTDFGFAKKMPARGKTFTFAGTPEYVAPEIVLNRGHDKAVDYWAFGAFVFELLTGRTPFRTGDSSHMRTYNKILNGIDNVNFPTYMNPKARNLIEKLCRPVPAERLGMQRGGTRDIKAHKWYQGFDWARFQQGQIPSSFKPKLRDLTDTSNFDLFKQDKDYPPDEMSGWDIHF